MQQSLRLGLLALWVAFAAACAEEVPDVNRVQPHYVEKSLFEGTWYYRQTVVDVPPIGSMGFNGIEGALDKVRWEIREKQLVAWRAYETIPGLDANEIREGAEFKGDPVAIFAINSHFDIIRDFNPQTGEQTNVVVENTSLNPWYERQYMRVDWTSNLVEDPVELGAMFKGYAAERNNASYVRETDPFDPDHAQIRDDFLMITNEYVLDPGPGVCYFVYGAPVAGDSQCGSFEVKVRLAFSKVDPADAAQFEPVPYLDQDAVTDADGRQVRVVTLPAGEDGALVTVECTDDALAAAQARFPDLTEADCEPLSFRQKGRFGFFRSERVGYDRRIGGGHDANRLYFANHHQIWKATKDEAGQPIPRGQRALRPVVYHLNPDFPEDLKAVTRRLSADWNAALMAAATAATGRSASEIEAQIAADVAASGELAVFIDGEGEGYGPGALFQVRENTCSAKGVEAYLARHPEFSDEVDTATRGEGLKIGNLTRACSALSWFSRQAKVADPFEWQQMGDLRFSFLWWVEENQAAGPLGYGPSSADIENGRIISGNAYIYGASVDSYARTAADTVLALNGELCEQDGDLGCLLDGRSYLDWVASGDTVVNPPEGISAEAFAEVSRRLGGAGPDMAGLQTPGGQLDKAAMMRQLKRRISEPRPGDPIAAGTEVPVDLGAARLQALKQDPAFRAKMVSPEMLRLLGPMFDWAPGDDVPEALMDLALDMAVDPQAFGRYHAERAQFFSSKNIMMADFIDDAVIGQALALKGQPREAIYQQLREEIFEAVTLHELGHTLGLRHNFEGSFDALNYPDEFWDIRERFSQREWPAQRLPEFQYSSIMDYGSRFNSDTKGLGKYDVAAMKYVYGGVAEVFDDAVPVPGRLDMELELNDFSKIPGMLGGYTNLTRRKDVPVGELVEDLRAGVRQNAERFAANPERPAADYWTDRSVPYGYCSDEYAGFYGTTLRCRRWDHGANHTEAVHSAIQRYWNYYLFSAYRRGREEGAFLNGFFGRVGRVAEYLQYPWQFYSFFDAYPVDLREDLLRAALTGLNFINQVLGTPEPGRYCRNGAWYLPNYFFSVENQQACEAINVPVGPGRDMYLDFDSEYVYRINYIGSYYDKINLIGQLAVTSTNFLSFYTDYPLDDRQFTIGYYRAFQDELVDVLRDLMLGSLFYLPENNRFANLVIDGKVKPQLLVDPRNLGGEAVTRTDPRIWSRVPYNLLFQGMALTALFNTTPHDLRTDFIEYLTIAEVGSGDDRLLGEGAETITFTHPQSGKQYVAAQTVDGRSLAYDLIQVANEYVQNEWIQARQDVLDSPENETAQENFADADRRLQDFVELMEDMRTLRSWVDVAR
ncbi:MAG: zinc-dependent metalloprotease [Myxococcales bacterium]|nr:zinc-dependent metalloprotease [Myxococcales bacterium]